MNSYMHTSNDNNYNNNAEGGERVLHQASARDALPDMDYTVFIGVSRGPMLGAPSL